MDVLLDELANERNLRASAQGKVKELQAGLKSANAEIERLRELVRQKDQTLESQRQNLQTIVQLEEENRRRAEETTDGVGRGSG